MRSVRSGVLLVVVAGAQASAVAPASAQSIVCCNVPLAVGGNWTGTSRIKDCQEYFDSAPATILRRMCEQRQWLSCINTARCSELPPEAGKASDPASGGTAGQAPPGKSPGSKAPPPQAGTQPKGNKGGPEPTKPGEILLIPGSPGSGTAEPARGKPPQSSSAAAGTPSISTQGLFLPLKSLRLDLMEITGGDAVQGTVELVQAPGVNGVTVMLESSHHQLAGVPPNVNISNGTASADTGPVVKVTFPIDTHAVSQTTLVTIRARLGVQTIHADLRIRPPIVKYASLDAPSQCDGNDKGTVKYYLTGPAPSGFKVHAHARFTHANGQNGTSTHSEIETVPTGNSAGSLRIKLSRCFADAGYRRCEIIGGVRAEPPGYGSAVPIHGTCLNPD